jgi:F0F1-type ATP synthase membrane subunit b/b'
MLEDYKQQGQTVVRKATEEAQRHHQQVVEQTREEVLTLRRRAHEEIESARAAAMGRQIQEMQYAADFNAEAGISDGIE